MTTIEGPTLPEADEPDGQGRPDQPVPPARPASATRAGNGSNFETLAVCGFIFGLFSIVIAVFALGMAARAVSESGGDSSAGGDGATAASGEQTTEITMIDFAFEPSEVLVAAGSVLELSNDGAVVHNLSVDGVASDMIDAGGSGELDLADLDAGTYEMRCDVPGHAEAGMTGSLTIE